MFKYLAPAIVGGVPATITLDQLTDARLKEDTNPLLIKFYAGGSLASLRPRTSR